MVLSVREQKMMGFIELKLKLLDAIIESSKEHGGSITTENLIEIKQEFIDYYKKMELAESIEENKINGK